VNLEGIAKILVGVGLGVLVLGGILFLVAKLGLNRLPGDFVYRGKNITVYVPIGLMVLVSLVASLVLHFLSRR
jgi:multisubunit Na+/H+ antiporter MnhG subunit